MLTPRALPSYQHMSRVLSRVLDRIVLVSVSRGLSSPAKAELGACVADLTTLISRLPAGRQHRKGASS
jgi:hypothetical protein